MSLVITVEPAEEPVTTAEAKDHMRVDTSDDDTLIDGLITASRLYAENYTNRAFVTQTLAVRLDAFPASQINLPRAPAASVTSIQYIDGDGATQTWSSANYTVDAYSKPARVLPVYDEDFPSTRAEIDAVTVTFVAGYGGASAVPEGLKLAIKTLVGHWYENREGSTYQHKVHLIPLAINALLTQFRIPQFL